MTARKLTPPAARRLTVARPERVGDAWREQAACRDTDMDVFFRTDDEGIAAALQVCAGCSVVDECLDWALTHREDYGVWGGATEQQRDRMRRRRRKGVAA